jgi:hypothetical protein
MILEVKKNIWINDFKKAEIIEENKIEGKERVDLETEWINLLDSKKKTDIFEAERLKHLLDEKGYLVKFTVNSNISVFSEKFESIEKARNYFLELTQIKLT